MRNVRMWVSLIGLSVFALTILRFFPGSWVNDEYFLNGILGYAPVALIFYLAIYACGLPTLEYFRLPRLSLKTLFAIIVASPLALGAMFFSGNEYKSWGLTISGALFVLSIGLGEEMISRGFVYGVLNKIGRYKAMFLSSFMFGLMHINVYLPNSLGWLTYWHVMSTFSFGLIMCALMIVSRSIWVPVVFHALADWNIPFEKEVTDNGETESITPTLWDNVTLPFIEFSFNLALFAIIMLINRAQPTAWMYRLALKWKLVNPTADISHL
jgi:membrane protease YdiL (CAAX protease family)